MAAELIDTAQAILTATDTALSKAYREEDRAWRKDDLAWRDAEREFMCAAGDAVAHFPSRVGGALQWLQCQALGASQNAFFPLLLQAAGAAVAAGGPGAAAAGQRACAVGSLRGEEQARSQPRGAAAAIWVTWSGAADAHALPLCRRDVEERAEQLKAISNLSALIAGAPQFGRGGLGGCDVPLLPRVPW